MLDNENWATGGIGDGSRHCSLKKIDDPVLAADADHDQIGFISSPVRRTAFPPPSTIHIPVGDAHLEAGIEKAPDRRKADAGSTDGDNGDTTGL
jgi:hypothetical protein